MGYKDKRSRPGLYYGTDGLIKTKDGTWVEDPKTFKSVPVRKAKAKPKGPNSVNV